MKISLLLTQVEWGTILAYLHRAGIEHEHCLQLARKIEGEIAELEQEIDHE